MNILTKTDTAYDEKNRAFQRPDPRSVLIGMVQIKFQSNGISLIPSVTADVRKLEEIIPRKPGDALFQGRWIDRIHFQITRDAVDGETKIQPISFAFRTQIPTDRAKIEALCEVDRICYFSIGWQGERLEMRLAVDGGERPTAEQQEFARINALYDPDLETEAARLGVIWDPEASRKTMVERMVAKSMERKEEAAKKELEQYGEAEQKVEIEKIRGKRGKAEPVGV